MSTTSIRNLREFVKLQLQKEKCKEKLVKIEEKLKKLSPQVIDYMTRQEIAMISVEGRTLYLDTRLWARPGPNLEACMHALKSWGFDTHIKETVNVQSLSALVREYVCAEVISSDPLERINLPEDIKSNIIVTEVVTPKVRKTN